MSTNHRVSLAELDQALTQWRTHRQGQCIPQWIRAQAVALLEQHRPCEIKAALGINHRTLKQWQAQCNSPSACADQTAQRPAFVALPVLALSEPETMLSFTLTRHGGDGSAVSVAGTLSWGQWHQALRLLSAGEVLR